VRLEDDKARQLLKRVSAKIGWNGPVKRQPYVGQGLAFCIREIGIGEANVEVGLQDSGRVYLVTTVPDTGTGSHTIFRQIAAETLGIAADDIEIIIGTTDHFSTDVVVAASRVTYLAGQATQKAVIGLRDMLLNEAAQILRAPVDGIRMGKRVLLSGGKQKISFAELASCAAATGRRLQVSANFQIQERGGTACFFAQAARIKVDPETGKISILKMFAAHDTGTVINPLTYQGQVEGGMMQGLGFALMENLRDDQGKIITPSLGEYKIPCPADVPALETLLFQDQDGPGPFHSKPVGEHSTVPTAPCIANALYDAIGKQLTDLPLSSEAVYEAMKSISASVNQPTRVGRRRRTTRFEVNSD
jgi:CO/xanthine dehydrogenase Mo-binding subunit